ncbi:MAG: serine/threonine protein kinase, partial [Deltaproteobacteria bacterium]|nr:serine/threonine protein kinase [Deltaproteobacteria bacterium]
MDPFSMVVAIVALVSGGRLVHGWIDARERGRRAELLAGNRTPPAELEALRAERKLLVERIENLETIVCGVDLELNQKIARLLDESRVAALPAAEATPPAPAAVTPASAAAPVVAPMIDATVTAPPSSRPRPVSSTGLVPGEVLANRYRIQRLLGKGGMGAVYLAHDEVLTELVALKIISSAWASDEAAMVERFKREAAAARKVSSPNVVRIHDLGEARPGLLYLSMEYVVGRTLSELIATRGVVPIVDCLDIIGQVCTGLAAAHDAGVIHRDLKPGNVL